jgi:hypothetical protein
MEIYYPYTTLEEKQGVLDANTDKTFLRYEQIREKLFIVFDDGVEPPFTIPDEVVKEGFIEMLSIVTSLRDYMEAGFLEILTMINALNVIAAQPEVSPTEFKDAIEQTASVPDLSPASFLLRVKARLGI